MSALKSGTVFDIADDELLRRAVASCRGRKHHPRWTAVMETFGLGRGYSRQLCARFGFDPDDDGSALLSATNQRDANNDR